MSGLFDDISKTTIQLILKEPFYGHFLSGVLKEISEEVDTLSIGVSDRKMITLYINELFWRKGLKSDDERYGVLKHEALHIVLKHIFRIRDFSNRDIFNIAADIVVNQYIHPDHLPAGAVTLEQFDGLGLQPHQDVGYYYRELLKAWKEQTGKEPGAPGMDSQAGNYLDDLMKNGNEHLEKHRLWARDFADAPEADCRVMERPVDKALEETMNRLDKKHIGSLPATLKAYLEGLSIQLAPQVNWRRVLRLFAAGGSRTYLKETIRRPSKRYGTTPGIKVKRRHKLLVAVDTSGSVQLDELRAFFSEIYQIWRQGIEVMVVECDVVIGNRYLYRGVAPASVSGRGGTAFDDPLRYANEDYHPDAVIYFTDGYGPPPSVKSRAPVLWVITPKGAGEKDDYWNALPGRKVKMNH
jgi:predicted metal-dependent peptidase